MYEYLAEVIKIVDGDTVDLKVDLGFHCTITERFRLEGIDTPERGEDGFREAGDYLSYLLKDCSVLRIYIRTEKQGSFRRWLGTLMVVKDDGSSQNINKHMIKD